MKALAVAFASLAALLTTARPAPACSYVTGIAFVQPPPAGVQPRNAGVIASYINYSTGTEWSFRVVGGEQALAVEVNRLLSPDPITHLVWLRLSPLPSGRVTIGAVRREANAPGNDAALQLDFSDQVDDTPPALEGLPAVWIHRQREYHSPCGSPPSYVLGARWTGASEAGFVSFFETTREGLVQRPLADILFDTGGVPDGRFAVDGEPGRTVCLRFKATDLAGNETPLGPVCCADEAKVTGPCTRAEAPPSRFPEVEASGGGCTVAADDRPRDMLSLLVVVIVAAVRSRFARRTVRPMTSDIRAGR